MMKFTTICVAIATALMIGDHVHGQLLKNLFGQDDANQSSQLGNEPFALGQSDSSPTPRKFRLPTLPSLFSGQNQQSDVLGQGESVDLSNAIPSPQLPSFNPPNLLNQFNSKSKQMIDRTTDWARDKQQQLKQKTFGRLGSNNPLGFFGTSARSGNEVDRSLSAATETNPDATLEKPSTTPPAKPDYFAPPKSSVPARSAQPPIRTASNPDGQPAARF